MSRKEKIEQFWIRNHENRLELFTNYLGYVPLESITYEDEVFVYDAYRHSLKERLEQPLLTKIKEREDFIVELFNAAIHQKEFKESENFTKLYEKYDKLISK